MDGCVCVYVCGGGGGGRGGESERSSSYKIKFHKDIPHFVTVLIICMFNISFMYSCVCIAHVQFSLVPHDKEVSSQTSVLATLIIMSSTATRNPDNGRIVGKRLGCGWTVYCECISP